MSSHIHYEEPVLLYALFVSSIVDRYHGPVRIFDVNYKSICSKSLFAPDGSIYQYVYLMYKNKYLHKISENCSVLLRP